MLGLKLNHVSKRGHWAPLSASIFSRVWTPSAVMNLTRDWQVNPLHPTSTGKTLHPHMPSSHFCCRSEYLTIFCSLAQLIGLPQPGTVSSGIMTKRSWSDQITRLGWSLVTTMWAGKTRGCSRSTIIFQTHMLETSDSLVLLLTIFWGFPMLQQTRLLGPRFPGVDPYIASGLHQQSPSGLGCMPRYTLVEKQQSLIECAPRYRAFINGCTERNPPPSTQVGRPGLGGDHTLISVACWFLTVVVLLGLSRKYSLGPPLPGSWGSLLGSSKRPGHHDLLLHAANFLDKEASPASRIAPGPSSSLDPPETSVILLSLPH